MDLFTYLMAKNGHNTSVHGDLFSYLLGKGQSQTYTISGVTIYIPNAKKLVNFMMTKESTQDGTPTPENPIPINVVKGFRNYLSDLNKVGNTVYFNGVSTPDNYIFPKGTYTFYYDSPKTINTYMRTATGGQVNLGSDKEITITATEDFNIWLWASGLNPSDITSYQLSEGIGRHPYVPYGNNYVDVQITGKNKFNKDTVMLNYRMGGAGTPYADNSYALSDYIPVEASKDYTYSRSANGGGSSAIGYYDSNKNFISRTMPIMGISSRNIKLTTPSNASYVRIADLKTILDNIQYELGDLTTYEAYKETTALIPLNNNEIAGIGEYLDELIVDKSGNVFINKKTGKVVLDGTEEWQYYNGIQYIISINNYKLSGSISMCPYYQSQDNVTSANQMLNNHIAFRNDSNNPAFYVKDTRFNNTTDFKTWLSTHNTEVYYVRDNPELIDLNTTVDLKLFKGANNITNSEEANMTIEYK